MSRTLGHYKITYESGITQTKHLISHEDYLNIIKPTQLLIYQYSLVDRDNPIISQLKQTLDKLFTEHWFTDQSPLWRAHSTKNLILPDTQGGTKKCLVINIGKTKLK